MTPNPSASPSGARGIICDMDGVIYHGNALLPGTRPFIDWLRQSETPFLFLTNSSERSPRELSEKLSRTTGRIAGNMFPNMSTRK